MNTDQSADLPDDASDILGNVDVWTPEIDRLAKRVRNWIRKDQPGGTAFGLQRIGKSRAAMYLKSVVPEFFKGRLGTALVAISDPPPTSRRELIQTCMTQTECDGVQHRDTEILVDRLLKHWAAIATAANTSRLLVILDEAQNCEDLHLQCLKTWHARLDDLKIRPFFLLIGQTELQSLSDRYMGKLDKQNLIGRFFATQHEIVGIADNEIAEVLKSFDAIDGEIGAGPRQALALQYGQGFELAQLAPPFVSAMQIIRRQHKVSNDLVLPMQYLRSGLIDVLIRIIEGDLDFRQVSTATVLAALKEVGFLQVVLAYATVRQGQAQWSV